MEMPMLILYVICLATIMLLDKGSGRRSLCARLWRFRVAPTKQMRSRTCQVYKWRCFLSTQSLINNWNAQFTYSPPSCNACVANVSSLYRPIRMWVKRIPRGTGSHQVSSLASDFSWPCSQSSADTLAVGTYRSNSKKPSVYLPTKDYSHNEQSELIGIWNYNYDWLTSFIHL